MPDALWMEVRDIVQETGIKIASPGSMHDTACSGLVHWDDPEAQETHREFSGITKFSCLSLQVIMLPRAELTVPSQESGCDTVRRIQI